MIGRVKLACHDVSTPHSCTLRVRSAMGPRRADLHRGKCFEMGAHAGGDIGEALARAAFARGTQAREVVLLGFTSPARPELLKLKAPVSSTI